MRLLLIGANDDLRDFHEKLTKTYRNSTGYFEHFIRSSKTRYTITAVRLENESLIAVDWRFRAIFKEPDLKYEGVIFINANKADVVAAKQQYGNEVCYFQFKNTQMDEFIRNVAGKVRSKSSRQLGLA